jgi:thiamine transport system permease protein
MGRVDAAAMTGAMAGKYRSSGSFGGVPLEGLLALPLVMAVLFSFIIPYGASFWNAFNSREKISVFENTALLHITLFTIKQAFFSLLVSLAIGLPGAWIIGNSQSRFMPVIRAVIAIPFAMPSILVVLGFVLFFGNSGWINRFLALLPGGGSLRILYRPAAIILAHGFFNFPLVIRLAGDGIARARKAYSPAASALGASPLICVLTIILPLSFPAVMSAALLVFLYSFTSFAVVLVLGSTASTTLAVEIFRYARVFLNYHNAGALALIETLIAVSVFLTYVFFRKKSGEIKVDVENRSPEEKEASAPARFFSLAYGVFAAFFIIGPIGSVVLESFLYRPSRSASEALGLIWWRAVFRGGWWDALRGDSILSALFRSLFLAFSSATAACVLAISGAFSVKLLEEKGGKPAAAFAGVVRFFAAAPLVSSGIVMGLGWLILYGGNLPPQALILLHGINALPFAFNSISEGFRSLPANTLNAALVSGAAPLRALFSTVLPLSLPRLRSAWGFAAALSLGELNAVMMLGMEKWETLPLYIYRATGAYRYGNACAAGTILIAVCGVCLFFSEWGRKNAA